MPLRTVAILASLLAASFSVLAIAWLTGTELYIGDLPSRYGFHGPPTPTPVIAGLLAILLAVGLWSPHNAMVAFTLFPALLILGSVAGFFVFSWTPPACQHLLTLLTGAAAVYAWTQRDDFDY